MAGNEYESHLGETDIQRGTEDIRQNVATEEEKLSQTVEQIGERIKEKLDWRKYVKDSPYWALGAAAGIGYFASRAFIPRTTPIERIMGSFEGVRDSLFGGLHAAASRPGPIKLILLGIATKAAAGWITNPISTAGTSSGGLRLQTGRNSTINPRIET